MTSTRLILLATLPVYLASCKTDDNGTTTVADEHGASDEHAASSDNGTSSEHGADTHDHSVDTDPGDAVVAYCSCMLANCHEPYHMKWGEDEMMAEQGCLAEAESVPSNGAPIEMGNFLECRQHFCDAAAMDPTVCTNALGDAVCM